MNPTVALTAQNLLKELKRLGAKRRLEHFNAPPKEYLSSFHSYNPMAGANPRSASTGMRIIMDTGCSDNILSKAEAARTGYQPKTCPPGHHRSFQGAGALTTCKSMVQCDLPELQESPDFWIMQQCPSLSSVGRRCMQHGFSFIWKAGKRPYWLTPWGTVVPLVVDNLIPYLVVGSTQCRPRAVLPEHLQIPQPRDIAKGKVAMGTPTSREI